MNLKYKYLLHRKSISSAYSDESEAVFALMDSAPPVWLKNKMNTYINFLIADGNWVLLKQLLFFAMDTEANSLIDWLGFVNAVNINSTPHTPVTQTHAGFAGFSPDGISKYINGGLLQGDMVKTNTFTHEYIFENLSANNAKLFGTSGNDGRAYQLSQSTQPDVRGQCNYFTTITSNPTLELFQNNSLYGIDNIALTVRIFKNGVSLNSAPVALLGNGNLPFYHGAFNSNGTAVQFLNSKLCMAVSGASVGFDHLAFYNRTLAFLQDLGIE